MLAGEGGITREGKGPTAGSDETNKESSGQGRSLGCGRRGSRAMVEGGLNEERGGTGIGGTMLSTNKVRSRTCWTLFWWFEDGGLGEGWRYCSMWRSLDVAGRVVFNYPVLHMNWEVPGIPDPNLNISVAKHGSPPENPWLYRISQAVESIIAPVHTKQCIQLWTK